jgi:hypothetical protein
MAIDLIEGKILSRRKRHDRFSFERTIFFSLIFFELRRVVLRVYNRRANRFPAVPFHKIQTTAEQRTEKESEKLVIFFCCIEIN